ncbi:NADP-dependent malic enzyme [Saguinus oedipus]|uniref:NADP-dependent malic enzyme n=1 Tax=Saguinus oedipus TaxID=9490 RepID=A0ABQ9TVW0_SAGOE|nr:NADP-dependent malic enzyme [Saguinus oedipus]
MEEEGNEPRRGENCCASEVMAENPSPVIPEKIVKDAYQEKTATVYPEPQNKEEFIRSQMYSTDYDQILPDCYSWPEEVQKIQTKVDQ